MALTKNTLYKVAGANPGLWIYKTADAVAAVTAADYFNEAKDALKQHDVIVVVDTNTPTVDLAIVTSADGAASVTTVATEGVTAS